MAQGGAHLRTHAIIHWQANIAVLEFADFPGFRFTYELYNRRNNFLHYIGVLPRELTIIRTCGFIH